MTSRIAPVDPADEDTFAALYDVYDASEAHDRQGNHVPMGMAAARDRFLRAPDDTRNDLFLAYDGATPVAAGQMGTYLTANRHLAELSVHVHPAHRRRGFGSAMLELLEAEAIAAKRTSLLIEAYLPPDAAIDESGPARFAAGHGYKLAMIDHRRQLDLPATADLDALAAEAAEHHQGYRIVAFQGRMPEEYLAGYSALVALLIAESPTGDVAFEPEDPDPQLERQREALALARGTVFTALALSPAGEVVAATKMGERPGHASQISQWPTIVRRDHRGHRLGLAVKIANLRQLGPGHVSVTTSNEHTNRHMIAVNELLGFYLIEQGVGFQKLIPATE